MINHKQLHGVYCRSVLSDSLKPFSFLSGGGCGKSYYQCYQRPRCQRKDICTGWVGVYILGKKNTVATVFVRKYIRDSACHSELFLFHG